MAVAVLCGGFGAARFVGGLADQPDVTCVVNVGDDFEYVGLCVAPDVDSVFYALAGCFDEQRGWGPTDDTFALNAALARYGDDWFRIGDGDLSLSLKRTELLRQGRSLSNAMATLGGLWDLVATVVPVTNDRVVTTIHTSEGALGLQEFLVRRRAEPEVLRVSYEGSAAAEPAPGVLDVLSEAEVVVLAPSNPVSSIGAILAVPQVRDVLRQRERPTVAVSPVVLGVVPRTDAELGRFAVRHRLLGSTGTEHRPAAIAALYRDFLHGFVADERDRATEAAALRELGLSVLWTDLLPEPGPSRTALAQLVVSYAHSLGARRGSSSA